MPYIRLTQIILDCSFEKDFKTNQPNSSIMCLSEPVDWDHY